jgi:hypothetical protein
VTTQLAAWPTAHPPVSSGMRYVTGFLPRVSNVTSWPWSISMRARYTPMKRVPPGRMGAAGQRALSGAQLLRVRLTVVQLFYAVHKPAAMCSQPLQSSPSIRIFLGATAADITVAQRGAARALPPRLAAQARSCSRRAARRSMEL